MKPTKLIATTLATAAMTTPLAWSMDQQPEILKPDWDSGSAPVSMAFQNGKRTNVTARIFGRQDVEKARGFGASLVPRHYSQALDEQIMNGEAYRRFGNTSFARFFVFEAKMGFSLEVQHER